MALTKVKGHILADDLTLPASATTTTQSASDNSTKIATTAYVTTALANLSDSAPSTLNTLNELAAALGDDANYATTTTNAIAAKLPLAGGTMSGNIIMGDNNITGINKLEIFDSADNNRLEIYGNASNGFIFDMGGTGSVGTINFNDFNVGIGTSNPSAPLHIEDSTSSAYGGLRVVGAGTGSGSTNVRQIADFGRTNSGSVSGVWLGGRTDETTAVIGAKTASGNIAFEVYNSGWQERMRITNSGILLVGKTTSNIATDGVELGTRVESTADGTYPLRLNRRNSDGDIALFRKDNTTVGSIGVVAGSLAVGGGDVFLEFNASSNVIQPMSTVTGGASNGVVDIGASLRKFKDLYLSGVARITDGILNSGLAGSATVFNEDGTTADFRVESDSNTHMLFVDGGTNNVGIATSNPNKPLTITSDSGANAIALRARSADDYSFFQFFNNAGTALRGQIYSKAAGDIGFTTGTDSSAGNDLYIKNGTGVGIGTNTPAHELIVHADSNPTLGIVGENYNDLIAIRFGGGDLTSALGNGNSGAAILSQQAVDGGQAKGDLRFQVNTGDQLSTAMFLSNAGNVGINCDAPEEKLTVDGGVKIANSNKRLYFGTEGGTSHRALEGQVDGSTLQVGEGYGTVLLGSASAKVGIRQNSPDAMLHIDGATNSLAGLIIEGNGNGDVIHQQFKLKANNGTLSYHGISASPGADQDDNTISFGNGAGNGVVVNHQNVVKTRYSEIHSDMGPGAIDCGGSYLGANGAGFGTHAIFRTPSVTSPTNAGASTQFLTVYSSGHWGEYPVCRFRLYTTYFNGGYREYLFRMTAGTAYLSEVTAYSNNTSWGAAPGSITKGNVSDTGTDHAGQSIYKCELTFNSTSAYYRNYVVVEVNYGANRYYGSGTSASAVDGYTNGGKYHFKTISLAESRGKFVS